ncbi:hypothetical protein [Nostoc sp. UHCC 0870]|uniref:hypothetical protein n=1 Tax=Nostoc sp. UHCC 0870 TaxID=2914041 RepID=UPI001EDD8569|nr:hypothetical protein [Nostoc sp. UHCC 0870]UKO97175.1 hypothetical protein L6494_21690 [Nostoc sp. UHCC 0870]
MSLVTAAILGLCGLFAIAWLKSRLGLMNDYEIEFAIALIPSSYKIILALI